jgi:hypothetical protein
MARIHGWRNDMDTSLASPHMLASQLSGTMDQSTDGRCVFQGAWEKMIQPGGAVKDGK